MADLFEPVIRKFMDLGIFNVFLFAIAFAIFYAVLRRSKVMGDSIQINAVVAFVCAFLIFSFQYVMGINLTLPLTQFFTQGLIYILMIFFGFIVASMFYPNMTDMLMDQFKKRSTLYVMIALGVSLLVTSGLIQVFWASATKPPTSGSPQPSRDVIIIAAGVIVFIVIIIIAAQIGRGESSSD
jgi:glucan phosphoethanolaminetransferase (alkaline phosphatase superfamily)